MLKKSLVAKISPKARKENIVIWEDYRVTVLSERLFRLEKSDKKIFRDEATQSVWFRDTPRQEFKVKYSINSATIQTSACSLILRKNINFCRIKINGKTFAINNSGNLGGTCQALDRCDGEIFIDTGKKVDLGCGVCSRKGIAVFDDSESFALNENGEVIDEKANGIDEYIFVFGDNYRDAVNALYSICGYPPFIPRFALGNWWSRYHAYTDREYLSLLTKFEEKQIPLTVATVDMDWHYSTDLDGEFKISEKGRNTDYYGGDVGWWGYSWNKHLFPDYKEFLKKIKEKNLKITLNLHPEGGVRWFDDAYEKMATTLGVNPNTAQHIKYDFKNSDFINAYFDILHKPYEKDGVDFWWIDGFELLWSLNHYHFLDNSENHYNPLILSRFAGIGSHRYPLGFSGDTLITWNTLKYLCYFTANASNVGFTWWSHDIGGHQFGEHNNQMFLRHVQYGVFSPINRLHGNDSLTMTKEPWAYNNGTGELIEKWLRFRHSMIPLLYTYSYLTHVKGLALIEPLYYEWKDEKAYKYKEEYLFGGLLVAPISKPLNRDGYATVKMWVPEGRWTDIFTGDFYDAQKGGKEITAFRTLESIPVFAKAGTILPLSMDKGNSALNPTNLGVKVYSGNGEFTLFEDGRELGNTKEVFTYFKTWQPESNKQIMTISSAGDFSVLPSKRKMRVTFEDIFDGEIEVYKNDEKLLIDRLYLDCLGVEFEYQPEATYTLKLSYKIETELEKIIIRAQKVLLMAECLHEEKRKSYENLQKVQNIQEYVSVVNESNLSKSVKSRLLECL